MWPQTSEISEEFMGLKALTLSSLWRRRNEFSWEPTLLAAPYYARAAHALDIPTIIESPQLVFQDQASIFVFNEAKTLLESGAVDIKTDQCMYGAPSRKPTCLRLLLPKDRQPSPGWAMTDVTCNHQGKIGKMFKSDAAKVYPPQLNSALATINFTPTLRSKSDH